MQRRRLGGLEVSAIGLGCATMTPFYDEPDSEAAIETVRHAREIGVDFLDSSDAYGSGRNEEVMVAGKPRSLTATHWQIFMLLYRHRGDVVSNDRTCAELSEWQDHPSTHPNTCGSSAGSRRRGTRSSIIGPRL